MVYRCKRAKKLNVSFLFGRVGDDKKVRQPILTLPPDSFVISLPHPRFQSKSFLCTLACFWKIAVMKSGRDIFWSLKPMIKMISKTHSWSQIEDLHFTWYCLETNPTVWYHTKLCSLIQPDEVASAHVHVIMTHKFSWYIVIYLTNMLAQQFIWAVDHLIFADFVALRP